MIERGINAMAVKPFMHDADPALAAILDGTAISYTVRFTGMDGEAHTEEHLGHHETLAGHIAFLEERGAHCLSVTQDDTRTVYDNGGFVVTE